MKFLTNLHSALEFIIFYVIKACHHIQPYDNNLHGLKYNGKYTLHHYLHCATLYNKK